MWSLTPRKLMARFRWLAQKYVRHQGFYLETKADPEDVKETINLLKPRPLAQSLIRIGGDNDGGYLVPDDLENIDGCFSPGVSTIATFEEMLAQDHGIPCFLADYSVDAAPVENNLFDFEKKYLGSQNDDVFIRLEDWIARKESGKTFNDLILQMDIEGSEYDVIIDTPTEVFERFRIIVAEIHYLDAMLSKNGLRLMRAVLAKLTRNHVVVHLHPNNCCGVQVSDGLEVPRVLELTLLRKDRFVAGDQPLSFPNPLDQPNIADRNDIILPASWY